MTDKFRENNHVDELLHAAKEAAPPPPNDLMSRVLADAVAMQAGFYPPRDAAPRRGFWHEFFRVLGGWPAMAGLVTATVTGVWLGAFPPGFLPDATSAYLGLDDPYYLIDTTAGLGFDLGEEAL